MRMAAPLPTANHPTLPTEKAGFCAPLGSISSESWHGGIGMRLSSKNLHNSLLEGVREFDGIYAQKYWFSFFQRNGNLHSILQIQRQLAGSQLEHRQFQPWGFQNHPRPQQHGCVRQQ